jgi:hypothetical protein
MGKRNHLADFAQRFLSRDGFKRYTRRAKNYSSQGKKTVDDAVNRFLYGKNRR